MFNKLHFAGGSPEHVVLAANVNKLHDGGLLAG